jgi:hypothetical protein
VFFQSPDALTPHALNDVIVGHFFGGSIYAQNVYEWELAGTPGGSCPPGAPGGACVSLISDGRDVSQTSTQCGGNFKTGRGGTAFDSGVCLLGTDATGANVFFTTADRLVSKDTDTQVDTYDARTCEPENGNPCITEPPSPLPPCGGEACHGIPAATPSGLTPGTASFNGEGNITPPPPPKGKTAAQIRAEKLAKALKACKSKHNKKQRKSCESSARKRYGSKGKKSVKANRRAHR